jgi:hypothetical protein
VAATPAPRQSIPRYRFWLGEPIEDEAVCIAHAALAAGLTHLGAKLDLLEDGHNLTFTESGFFHVEIPGVGILYSQMVQVFAGASLMVTSALDVKPKIWPESFHRSGIASVFAHLVVTSIYTLAAAT